MRKILVAVAVGLLLTTMRLSAHHAFAADYDEKKVVTISGTFEKHYTYNLEQITTRGLDKPTSEPTRMFGVRSTSQSANRRRGDENLGGYVLFINSFRAMDKLLEAFLIR